jgi:hypothetical protein
LYRSLLRDARFSELLMEMDRDRLNQARSAGCSKCGGPLPSGHFDRKPSGILVPPEQLPEGYMKRFDLCCGWCRSRTLPASVRFLGRKVFLAVAIVVATAMVRGGDRNAVEILRRQLGASRSTVARWCRWWRALTETQLWIGARGTLPVDLDERELPASLLARYAGSTADRMAYLLRFLRPLSGRVPEQAG